MEGGADFILFETQPTRAALEHCAAAMRQLPDVPFVLSFAIVDQRRDGLGRIGRADAGPVAGRLAAADRLGHELRHAGPTGCSAPSSGRCSLTRCR